MIKFLQNLFKTKKTFPEKSGKTAMLYIVVKCDDDPQAIQMLAMSSGAPIFFTKSEGGVTGRCGLPKVEFPPTDFASEFLLDNVANFLSLLRANRLQYSIESENLCEADFNNLAKYLKATADIKPTPQKSTKKREGIYVDFLYMKRNHKKIVDDGGIEFWSKLNLLLHCGYMLDESNLTFFKPSINSDAPFTHEIPIQQVLTYSHTDLGKTIYIAKENDKSAGERYLKMNNDSRSYFSAHHADKHETTFLEVINAISSISEPMFSNVKQELLIKTYLLLKDIALGNPRLCYNLDEAISISKLNFSDHNEIEGYNYLAKLLLDKIFVSKFFLEASRDSLGDTAEYPHNTSKLDEKDLIHHVTIVCERGFAVYADSIELVENQNKTLIKMVQSGSNMPRSEGTWRREIYFDVTGRKKNETLIWKIRAQVRIDDDKG